MSRLTRFEEYRFLGTRDDMKVYDCDEAAEFAELGRRVADDHLLKRNLIQTFAPDEAFEAANRGFRRARSSE